MFSRFDTISERDRQTDGQSYLYQYRACVRIAVLTRDKNVRCRRGVNVQSEHRLLVGFGKASIT